MARKAPNTGPPAVVQYDNADAPPAYVESVQGMLTPHGALHLSFFRNISGTAPKYRLRCSLGALIPVRRELKSRPETRSGLTVRGYAL